MDQRIYKAGQEKAEAGVVVTKNETLAPLYESQPYPTMLNTQAKRTRFTSNLSESKKMLEDTSKKSKWSWNSGNSKHGDEIGVGGQKLKLSNIGINLHVGSPLPSEWHQCLDLQVFFVFFLIIYCVFLLFMFFFLCCVCGGDEMDRS